MKLSIITATWNSECTLKSCLDSVAQQSAVACIEHIIIDGRSSDSTLVIASQYPHISQIVSAKDRGIYHAFNRGVELATGDIIYFLGSDDRLYDNDVISDVLAALSSDNHYYLGSVLCEDSETGSSYFTRTNDVNHINWRPCHQGFFCRRDLFERFGNFNECFTIGADMYLMKVVMQKTTGIITERPIAKFSLQGLSSSSDNQAIVIRQHEMIDALIDGHAAKYELPELLALQRHTNGLLKKLLLSLLQGKIALDTGVLKRVGVFGTRELSQIISLILHQSQIDTICFVVSEVDSTQSIPEIPVVSLSDLSRMGLDTVINCIEGKHESEITERIQQSAPGVTVISWRLFCHPQADIRL
ncbi:glycosyltransferase [Aeromonas salmonicida subsp. salmonicida]|nr:glycosyltransferase [Aeromonas salmonicida subsp. salmonicida]